jgi:hypothetical protein
MATQIYVNLPVKSVERSVEFFTQLLQDLHDEGGRRRDEGDRGRSRVFGGQQVEGG